MKKHQVFQKLEQAWTALKESYAGLPDAQITEPGVMGEWSVKDILAHVTTWEEEALKYLPLILSGGRPPRYIQYGGIDAFNVQVAEQKRDLALSEVLRQREDTHRRLFDYLHSVPEEHFTRETPFRHRLRLDTYSHYPLHARAIREWRGGPAQKKEGEKGGPPPPPPPLPPLSLWNKPPAPSPDQPLFFFLFFSRLSL